MKAHGTRSRYNHDGCRCHECRKANADYIRLTGADMAPLGRPPAVNHERRRCAAEGCRTILSAYNPGDTCWVHQRMGVL